MSLSLPAGAKADDVYLSPITITQGGTYSGNWQSSDPNTPAVNIQTSDPVVIENSKVKGPGQLIDAENGGANLTVRNTYGYGVDPSGGAKSVGQFVKAYKPNSVVVEHCYTDNTGGVYVIGDHVMPQSLKIRYNRAHNVNARMGNNSQDAHYVQLDKVQNTPGVEIAWNEVINEPNNSVAAELINIYQSSGTPSSRISIHDNYLQGAYKPDPANDSTSVGGGGIATDGEVGQASDVTAFVEGDNNQIISTTNDGIIIAAGHDNEFHDNRIIASGLLPNGKQIAGQNVGLSVWDEYDQGLFYNNSGHDNIIGWMGPNGARNDWWMPDCSGQCSNTAMPDPITLDTEKAEYQIWLDKVSSNNVTIGPAN